MTLTADPQPPPPPPAKRRRSLGGLLLRLMILCVIWGGIALGLVIGWFAYDMPNTRSIASLKRRPTLTLLAADGTRLMRYGDAQSEILSVGQLPKNLINAVLATEDRRFYYHFGIDPVGLVRAAVTNYRQGRTVQGGSTITQQLAKILFLTPERTFRRKVQEALLAIWLERTYTKDEILTAYLNRAYLGSGSYGIDAAARQYFGKPATRLNLLESAIIAGLLRAPSRYSPARDPVLARQRARVVLIAMVSAGKIARPQMDDALAGRFTGEAAAPTDVPLPGGNLRYAADWIADQADDYVGTVDRDLTIRTTIDPQVQAAGERALAARLAADGERAKVGQAALIAMSPGGAVRALIGGRDYDKSPYNRATQATRQPGSAFKPIVYATALAKGFLPEDTILDAKLTIGGWSPQNYEGKFLGPVTLSEALAKSLNTATVRLAQRIGIGAVRALAGKLGIKSRLNNDLSLSLGTSEVSLMELTTAYAAFANNGRPVTPYAIEEIRDTGGEVLYRREGGGLGQVLTPKTVAGINGMLLGVVRSGTGRAAAVPGRVVAGKTGTTQEHRDAWFIGFSGNLVAGVWFGNDDNKAMADRTTGGSLAARAWGDFMTAAEKRYPPRALPGLEGAAPTPVIEATPVHSETVLPAGDGNGDQIGALIESLKDE